MFNNFSMAGMTMLFAIILGWVITVIAVIAILQWLYGNDSNTKKTPLEILEIRYAKGEMNRREYLDRRSDLVGEVITKKSKPTISNLSDYS